MSGGYELMLDFYWDDASKNLKEKTHCMFS